MNTEIQSYQREFLDFAIDCGVLRFGQFTLKSGRVSPYFFNTGLFNTGLRLHRLGCFYAAAILDAGTPFDMVFGPAYKGIPLVATTAIALAEALAGRSEIPYAFNRKEAKDHGEGGLIVGSPLQGRVLIIDDVISAGTSVRESVSLIEQAGATPAGVAIALDRQERGLGLVSAVTEVEQAHGFPVVSIANLDTLIAYLQDKRGRETELAAIAAYRHTYGIPA
jgi:orotate phosphoribosyltransferase